MKSRTTSILAVLATLFLAGSVDAQTKKSSDLILADEFDGLPATTSVYDAIRSLRPLWLSFRGQQSVPPHDMIPPTGRYPPVVLVEQPQVIVVYFEAARFGTQDSLRDLTVGQIASVEHLNPAKATRRWGAGHQYGAIVVRAKNAY